MNKQDRIFIAGHQGLVGAALLRRLSQLGMSNIVTRTHAELDLRNQADTFAFFRTEQPKYVFLAAAKVGGILANDTYRGEFIYDNLAIAANVIEAARQYHVEKLLNLGSSCIYPKLAPQPLREQSLLTGPLEPTNEPYAVAKIAALKLCRSYNEQYGTNFISAMPTNLYGPGDNYDLETSHVLPALMRKVHRAKQDGGPVEIWGDGTPMREFLYVDDLADAAVFLMETCDYEEVGEVINVGTGVECTIKGLAKMMCDVAGYRGELVFDSSKPNGTPRKLLDVSRMSKLGWQARTSLESGLKDTYRWFVENRSSMDEKPSVGSK